MGEEKPPVAAVMKEGYAASSIASFAGKVKLNDLEVL